MMVFFDRHFDAVLLEHTRIYTQACISLQLYTVREFTLVLVIWKIKLTNVVQVQKASSDDGTFQVYEQLSFSYPSLLPPLLHERDIVSVFSLLISLSSFSFIHRRGVQFQFKICIWSVLQLQVNNDGFCSILHGLWSEAKLSITVKRWWVSLEKATWMV